MRSPNETRAFQWVVEFIYLLDVVWYNANKNTTIYYSALQSTWFEISSSLQLAIKVFDYNDYHHLCKSGMFIFKLSVWNMDSKYNYIDIMFRWANYTYHKINHQHHSLEKRRLIYFSMSSSNVYKYTYIYDTIDITICDIIWCSLYTTVQNTYIDMFNYIVARNMVCT